MPAATIKSVNSHLVIPNLVINKASLVKIMRKVVLNSQMVVARAMDKDRDKAKDRDKVRDKDKDKVRDKDKDRVRGKAKAKAKAKDRVKEQEVAKAVGIC